MKQLPFVSRGLIVLLALSPGSVLTKTAVAQTAGTQTTLAHQGVLSQPKHSLFQEREWENASARYLYASDVTKALSETILRFYPDARIEMEDGTFSVRRRSDKFTEHLLDSKSELSKAEASQFPADFDEFWLQMTLVRKSPTILHSLPATPQTEAFGATLRPRIELKPWLWNGKGGYRPDEIVAGTHRAYIAYDKLAAAGLVASRSAVGKGETHYMLTRQQFASAASKLRTELRAKDRTGQPLPADDLLTAYAELDADFSGEIEFFERGNLVVPTAEMAWHRWRNDIASVNFSYGRGTNPEMLETIRQILR